MIRKRSARRDPLSSKGRRRPSCGSPPVRRRRWRTSPACTATRGRSRRRSRCAPTPASTWSGSKAAARRQRAAASAADCVIEARGALDGDGPARRLRPGRDGHVLLQRRRRRSAKAAASRSCSSPARQRSSMPAPWAIAAGTPICRAAIAPSDSRTLAGSVGSAQARAPSPGRLGHAGVPSSRPERLALRIATPRVPVRAWL